MHAPEPLQLRVAKRLRAHADPVDTGGAIRLHALDRHRLGIRLQRDFGVIRERKTLAARGNHTADVLGRQQRWRAPSKIDRVGARLVCLLTDVALERIDVARRERPVVESSVEIAVGANRATKGDVNVQAERAGVGRGYHYVPALPPRHFSSRGS